MAGQEITFDLEYRDKGQKKTLPLVIDFVPNICRKKYNSIAKKEFEVRKNWDKISDITTEISALRTEKPDNWKEQIEEKQKQVKDCADNIQKIAEDDFFEERFEIIKIILEGNNIKESFIHDFDFWDSKVDPAIMIEFITICIWKDIDKKKVQ